ncbi:MAG: hypothetical protein PHY34_06340 [Patescibacteria group bacterium]|nr:hypothetical protein [Patescibacteria group bacterium]MDD5715590.1 hypothetical protein [Patescibacteria group bacterium]
MSDVGKVYFVGICCLVFFLGAGALDLFSAADIPFWPVLWCTVFGALAGLLNAIVESRLYRGLIILVIGALAAWGSTYWTPFAFKFFCIVTVATLIVALLPEKK